MGVIGASRRRQGLGPFIVRDLVASGARIPCFLSTSEETARATGRELEERWGVRANAYLDLGKMLAGESLDALAILSPASTHQEYLDAAREAGLHVLCEKPFLWGGPSLSERARRIVSGFDEAGLILRENCPWPYTLSAFQRLHPEALAEPPRRFEMNLQPANPGLDRLGDSVPHALSLLQALTPGPGRVEDVRVSGVAGDAPALELAFSHLTETSRTETRLCLRHADTLPRQMSFAIDGRTARRVVDADYTIAFTDGDHSVSVEDPLPLLIDDFVHEIPAERRAPVASRAREIEERMAMLSELVLGYERAEARSS